jgi:hypothetical protein
MPSQVEVVSLNGPGPTINIITSDRYSTTDTLIDPSLAFANQVPGSGLVNRSMWKHRGLHIYGGNFSQLSNFRWGGPQNVKTVWGLGTKGGCIQVALRPSPNDGHGCTLAEYCQAKGVEGEYGYDIKASGVNGHSLYNTYLSTACHDMDEYGSGTPLVFDKATITAVGYTKFVVSQLVLYDDTAFGEKPILYEFWRWQEI